MKKHDLLKNENRIIRVLAIENDRVQIIDCIRRTMPVWIEVSMTEAYSVCQEKELLDITDMQIADMDTLDAEQKKTMYDRYTLIAPILVSIIPYLEKHTDVDTAHRIMTLVEKEYV